ncbi:hypothetical protein Haur_5052 (plasmid) [Herpetosiphon aurantiacus DSM 785]|uniref:DUF2809 domain-containing protein n=1 Tax=Herpetosiphon aurantiacus (strain ATCC 23779 / DSM 785 / 114-95) TaxID=316274 RepID=A9B8L6_HERA2|nr:hypothetical protein Haur_5052 [Herpetosiphon aurantiacus DSM 785]
MQVIQRRSIMLGGIVLGGILSRLVSTGFVVVDHYLGDALYAAMVFVLLLLFAPMRSRATTALVALVIVVLIEAFQLTGIPLQLRSADHGLLRLLAVVLGTTFNGWDIVSYAVGILVGFGLDWRMVSTTTRVA